VTRHYAESTSHFHERHNSKKEAEEAARMLADKAQFFSAEYSVEATVVCGLEWYDPD
jgi:hypothetical protein